MFDIELRIDNLSEKDREVATQSIYELVLRLTSGLSMEQLDSIVYTSSFKKDVLSFQRSKNIQQGMTEATFGSAVAKVLSYEENEQLKHTVFLDSPLFWLLFGNDNNTWAIHTLHHELGHVYDDSMRFQSYKGFEITRTDDIMTIACKIGEIMWMEYMADRLAIRSFTEKIGIRDDDVRNIALSMVKKINNSINEYFINGNSYQVFVAIQEESNLLLNITGNLLGRIHGLGLQEYLDRMQMEYFTPYLIRFSDELEKLHTKYPDWQGMRELLPLARVIIDLWELLGVSFDADDKGVKILISNSSVEA